MKTRKPLELVPVEKHNALTSHLNAWATHRVPKVVFDAARASFGTTSHEDDQRVYRTLQAAMHAEATVPGSVRCIPIPGCNHCDNALYMTSGYYGCAVTKRQFPAQGKPVEAPTWCPLPPYKNEAAPVVPMWAVAPTGDKADPLDLSRILHEMAGAVSLSWDPAPAGVFNPTDAAKHVTDALGEIRTRHKVWVVQNWDEILRLINQYAAATTDAGLAADADRVQRSTQVALESLAQIRGILNKGV